MPRERIASCLVVLLSAAQMHAQSGGWNRMKYFEGRWTGTGTGESGISAVQREDRYLLGGTCLHLTRTSTYAPRETSPEGEVHEERGIFESIENIPAGWQARETYRLLSRTEFTETIELAPPGGAFKVYSENWLKR